MQMLLMFSQYLFLQDHIAALAIGCAVVTNIAIFVTGINLQQIGQIYVSCLITNKIVWHNMTLKDRLFYSFKFVNVQNVVLVKEDLNKHNLK